MGKGLSGLVARFVAKFADINRTYVRKVGAQIKTIGGMNSASAHRMEMLAKVNADIADVSAQLAREVNVSPAELKKIYVEAEKELLVGPGFHRLVDERPLDAHEVARLEQMAEQAARVTAGALENFSKTTLMWQKYVEIVDRAILATTLGADAYSAAMRDAVADLGSAGVQVLYPSGYHRRLDTAVRANVLGGLNHLTDEASRMMGEKLGYEAIELTAHMRSAPDHEPVQGRVFLLSEFDKMQAGENCMDIEGNTYTGFKRAIGEWNCRHAAYPFQPGRSQRKYSDAMLQRYKDENAKGCTIDGRHYTLYQASQLCRRLETAVRKQMDIAIAAEAAGDDSLRHDCQVRINALSARYSTVCTAARAPMQKDRMLVRGFHRVNVK